MGQTEIYELLSRNKGKPFTAKELGDLLKTTTCSANVAAKKLAKTGAIKRTKYVPPGKVRYFTYEVE